MYANVNANKLGDQFKHVDISERMGVSGAIIVSVLKDPIAKVKEMFANTAVKAVLRPKLVVDAEGQRVYNEMWTADKWMTDQVCRALHYPTNGFTLESVHLLSNV